MKLAIELIKAKYDIAKDEAETAWRGDKNAENARAEAIEYADALTALGLPTGYPKFPHQVRVIEEKKELEEKITKLDAFIAGEKFDALEEVERIDLRDQRSAMADYSAVLGNRISRF